MIIDFTIEDLLLDSYLQKNFHTPDAMVQWRTPGGLIPPEYFFSSGSSFLSIIPHAMHGLNFVISTRYTACHTILPFSYIILHQKKGANKNE